MIYLISGNARSGKDTATKCFIDNFAKNGILAKRYAFADELKRQLDPLLLLNFGISAFTEDAKEKSLIRDLMISYGKMCRNIDPDYWVKIVAAKIKKEEKPCVAIISDCRYPNEFQFFAPPKKLIHITRLDDNGEPFPPVGPDEKTFNPVLEKNADNRLICKDFHDNLENLAIIGSEWFYEIFGSQLDELRAKYPL